MRINGGSLKAATCAAALALALAPLSLAAQSANDWRLPGATVRPAPPGSQGPVDRDNPVVTTAVPRSDQTATAAPSPAPSASRPAPTTVTPSAVPTRTATPRPVVVVPRQTGPAVAPATSATTAGTTPPVTDGAAAAPSVSTFPTDLAVTPVPVAPVAESPAAGWYWPWIAGTAVLLALIFAGLWWRRSRQPQVLQIEFERPIVPVRQPKTASEPPAAAPVQLRAAPEPQLSLGTTGGLGVTLEARRMSASLMATTLSYALTLTNTGSEPLTALAIEGDMVSAHASLPPEAQIASGGQRLEPRHNLVTLAPGESAEFTGDFRLPLTAVTPIRSGDAAYFVPLARLRVAASTAKGESLIQVQTYVVGELPEDPAAALKPFRLDLGPRTYSRIGQRAVN